MDATCIPESTPRQGRGRDSPEGFPVWPDQGILGAVQIEFKPDFHIRPIFKAVMPKISEAFKGLRLKIEGLREGRKRLILVLSITILLVLTLVLVIRAI